jgi:hypothetical protein
MAITKAHIIDSVYDRLYLPIWLSSVYGCIINRNKLN